MWKWNIWCKKVSFPLIVNHIEMKCNLLSPYCSANSQHQSSKCNLQWATMCECARVHQHIRAHYACVYVCVFVWEPFEALFWVGERQRKVPSTRASGFLPRTPHPPKQGFLGLTEQLPPPVSTAVTLCDFHDVFCCSMVIGQDETKALHPVNVACGYEWALRGPQRYNINCCWVAEFWIKSDLLGNDWWGWGGWVELHLACFLFCFGDIRPKKSSSQWAWLLGSVSNVTNQTWDYDLKPWQHNHVGGDLET